MFLFSFNFTNHVVWLGITKKSLLHIYFRIIDFKIKYIQRRPVSNDYTSDRPVKKSWQGLCTTRRYVPPLFFRYSNPRQSILFPLPPTGLFIESVNPRSVYFASSGKLTSTLGNSSCSLTSNLSTINLKFFAYSLKTFFQTI